MERALRMCLKSGCTSLVRSGYCDKHRHINDDRIRQSWDALNKRKPQWKRDFYSSSRWTQCSVLHRIREPLCRKCREADRITPADLTHHEPDLDHLVEQGLNPYSDKYLVSVCHDCHQKELRDKRQYAHA